MKGYNSDYGSGNIGSGDPINGSDYNRAGSSSVRQVDSVDIVVDAHNLGVSGTPDSVVQNYKGGKLFSERYFDSDGNAYLDIDYSDHGNAKMHPKVPHQHKISFINGEPKREKIDTEVK